MSSSSSIIKWKPIWGGDKAQAALKGFFEAAVTMGDPTDADAHLQYFHTTINLESGVFYVKASDFKRVLETEYPEYKQVRVEIEQMNIGMGFGGHLKGHIEGVGDVIFASGDWIENVLEIEPGLTADHVPTRLNDVLWRYPD